MSIRVADSGHEAARAELRVPGDQVPELPLQAEGGAQGAVRPHRRRRTRRHAARQHVALHLRPPSKQRPETNVFRAPKVGGSFRFYPLTV